MADIALHGVTKCYPNGHVAVHDIDLDVIDGELLVLVGPSGCGKSTLLRMVAGLEEVTEGQIVIGGRDVTDAAPKDRDIAMVFQSYALYPHLTVRRNIGYPLKLAKLGKAEIDKRVEEAARLLQLEPVLDRPRDDEDEDGGGIADSGGIDDPGFSVAEDAATVERLMRVLTEREREVLRLRFEEDLTQSEIGQRVGVSQMHVSRLIRQSVARLREVAETPARSLDR